MTLSSKIIRENIGNKIQWEESHDHHRGTCIIRRGTIEDLDGKNIVVDGDWIWYPNMINPEIIKTNP